MFDTPAPFVFGANLPWITYGGDFGANHWRPNGGLASSGIPSAAQRALVDLRERGVTVLRWFLFCDGRAGIRFEGDQPAGIDDRVFADIDAALAVAEAAGQRVMFVLFDFHWCLAARQVNGVQLSGRRRIFTRAESREALVDRVVAPLLRRYAHHPTIAAWDIINEPEWVTWGLGHMNPFTSVSHRQMRAFIRAVSTLAHALGSQPVTVGSASARWLPLVSDVGLDFYQVHWYDQIERGTPPRPVRELGLDRPVILGEFPTRGSAHPPDVLLDMAGRAGYTGAFAWSLLADDEATSQHETSRAFA